MFNCIQKKSLVFRLVAGVINLCFIASFMSPVRSWAQSPAELGMPVPGVMVNLTPAFTPVLVKGLRVHPENPVLFDFMVDAGKSKLTANDQQLKVESEKLIKYFLASLTIPDEDLWVNLSPYEKDRIIPDQLGQTEMGRDMLAQDYVLKQITASLVYPEKSLGKEFWSKVYAKSQQLYGNAQVPVNTFNKVWILPDKAGVYVHDNTAFVVEAHFKVMLEEDYLSLEKHSGLKAVSDSNKAHNIGNQIVREVVLPELEKEVNLGKNFANLRQIFNSMILATWYKHNLKQALLNQVYSNKAKINGVDVSDKTIKEQIYQEYLKAYKKGVFNYIKEDIDQVSKQAIPRKYFSGGENWLGRDSALAHLAVRGGADTVVREALIGNEAIYEVKVGMEKAGSGFGKSSAAMLTTKSSIGPGVRPLGPVNVKKIKAGLIEKAVDLSNNYTAHMRSAREFLRTQHLAAAGDAIDSVKVMFIDSDDSGLGFGYALDKEKNVIYLDKKGKAILEEDAVKHNHFDFLTRTMINLVAGNKYDYLYAHFNYQETIVRKFPKGSDPVSVIEQNHKGLLIDPELEKQKESQDYPSTLQGLVKKILHRPLKAPVGVEIENPDDNAYKVMREADQVMQDTFYGIGVSVLNGIVDTTTKFKDNLNKFKTQAKLTQMMLILFASKLNPITIAHLDVTIGAVMYQAIQYFADQNQLFFNELINVSKEDPLRKPEVGRTYDARYFFAQKVLPEIFGDIVQLLEEDKNLDEFIEKLRHDPELKDFVDSEGKLFDRLNGEENLHRLVRILSTIGLQMAGYPIGGDHLRVFVLDKANPGFIDADKMTSDMVRNVAAYYARINPLLYADLIIGQHTSGAEKIFDEQRALQGDEKQKALKSLYEAISSAGDDVALILKAVESATYLPKLDTYAKAIIIKSEKPDFNLVLFHTVRGGEDVTDAFRDSLNKGTQIRGRQIAPVPIVDVAGIDADISATNIRDGLVKIVRDGVFDFRLLASANRSLLDFFFKPTNERMLNVILRQKDGAGNELVLPKSISKVWNVDEELLHKERVAQLADDEKVLQDEVWSGDKDVKIVEKLVDLEVLQFNKKKQKIPTKQKGTRIEIEKNGVLLGSVEYYVVNGFDSEGHFVNHIVFSPDNVTEEGSKLNGLVPHSIDFIKNREKKFNDAVDSAMLNPAEMNADAAAVSVLDASLKGGIDLNSKNMQMGVSGDKIDIKFNPALIEQFKQGDFSGIHPVIINISPIANIYPLLGLKEEDFADKLAKV